MSKAPVFTVSITVLLAIWPTSAAKSAGMSYRVCSVLPISVAVLPVLARLLTMSKASLAKLDPISAMNGVR